MFDIRDELIAAGALAYSKLNENVTFKLEKNEHDFISDFIRNYQNNSIKSFQNVDIRYTFPSIEFGFISKFKSFVLSKIQDYQN